MWLLDYIRPLHTKLLHWWKRWRFSTHWRGCQIWPIFFPIAPWFSGKGPVGLKKDASSIAPWSKYCFWRSNSICSKRNGMLPPSFINLENPCAMWSEGKKRNQENLGILVRLPEISQDPTTLVWCTLDISTQHQLEPPKYHWLEKLMTSPKIGKSICRHHCFWRKLIIHRSSLQWLIVMLNVDDQEVMSHHHSGVFLTRLNVITD